MATALTALIMTGTIPLRIVAGLLALSKIRIVEILVQSGTENKGCLGVQEGLIARKGYKAVRVLAIHSNLGKDQNTWSAVDTWRIKRPIDELKKHVDWEIDEQLTPIPGMAKYKNKEEFTQVELEKAFKKLCEYDIIFSSYHADPTGYTMFKVARDKAGTQFIMDCDDDMFSVNPDNPFWVRMDDEKCYWMQRMIADNDWISTTTEALADVFRKRRPDKDPDSVFVNPNFITDQYKHPEFDNGDKIVIGYFGGASHYKDLNETGVAEALEKLMHENIRAIWSYSR